MLQRLLLFQKNAKQIVCVHHGACCSCPRSVFLSMFRAIVHVPCSCPRSVLLCMFCAIVHFRCSCHDCSLKNRVCDVSEKINCGDGSLPSIVADQNRRDGIALLDAVTRVV
jgi:hypothetical protein